MPRRLTGLCFWYAIGMEVSTDPIKYLSRSVPVRVAHDVLEREMRTSRSIELVVEAGREGGALEIDFLKRVDALERALEQEDGVTTIISIVRMLKEINQALADGDHRAYALPPDSASAAQQMLLYTLALAAGHRHQRSHHGEGRRAAHHARRQSRQLERGGGAGQSREARSPTSWD